MKVVSIPRWPCGICGSFAPLEVRAVNCDEGDCPFRDAKAERERQTRVAETAPTDAPDPTTPQSIGPA